MNGSTLRRSFSRSAIAFPCALTLLFTLSNTRPPLVQAGMNPEARLAFDMRAPAPPASCGSLRSAYPTCAFIVPSRAETGEFEGVVVLYTVQSVRAVNFTLQWPPGWTMESFESCGDFVIGGDVSENPMPVAVAWGLPQLSSGTAGIPLGILRGSASAPGCLEFMNPGPGGEELQIVGGDFVVDPAIGWYAGCAGVAAPASPCAFDSVLIAIFRSDLRVGEVPFAVRFEDRSRGFPDDWRWDFGDGGTSSEQSPVYVYTACGDYDVTLAVSRSGARDDTTASNYIHARETVVPGFSHAPGSGCRPLAVAFHDESLGHPTAWSWNFGDGGTSTERDPVHTYSTPGLFTVGLTASNACTTVTAYRPYAVTVSGPPTALFSADHVVGCAPSTVAFQDHSAGAPTTWLWDFGDGSMSGERHPVHTYVSPGDFDVSLTVANACSTSILSRPGFIRLSGEYEVDFAADATKGCAPLVVHFTDLSPPGGAAWLWDFGDGEFSTERSPVHTYLVPGQFDVQLTVSTLCGAAVLRREDYIQVPGSFPIAGFSANPLAGCAPLAVDFASYDDTTATAWLWDFGDGGTSTESDPRHVYASPGLYDVALTVTNSCGTSSTEAEGYIAARGGPATAFEAAPRRFCGADTVWFTDRSDSTAASWLWDFGDGSTSTAQNPLHVYAADGLYSVRLTTANNCGSSSAYERDYIGTGMPPVPRFIAEETVVCEDTDPVSFHDLTDGVVTGWLWEFGDGETSTAQNPVHYYHESGLISVGLWVQTPCGEAFAGRPEYITVLPDTHEDCRGPVATLLLGPEAMGRDDGVLVRWTVQSPSPFTGYFVARAAALAGPWTRLHDGMIPDRATAVVRSYEYLDDRALAGEPRFYRLEAQRRDGTRADYAVPYPVARAATAPRFLALWLGAPAPSPSAGTVHFELGLPPGATSVELALYDPAGRRVATIFTGALPEGRQAILWDGRDESGRAVRAGIYFARATAAGQTETRKVILAR